MSEIRIVFDGPPSHESGRFVEVENTEGESISVGEWHKRPDGLHELRIRGVDLNQARPAATARATASLENLSRDDALQMALSFLSLDDLEDVVVRTRVHHADDTGHQGTPVVSIEERLCRIRRGEPDPWSA